MKQKIFSALIVLLCLSMLVGAGLVLWTVIPQKAPENVTSLETNGVFGDQDQPVEPDREEVYDGTIVAPVVEPEEVPEEPAVEVPEEPALDPLTLEAQAVLDTMSLEEKVWQLFFVRPEALTDVNTATRAGDATKQALAQRPVGGIVYFAKNLEDAEQTTTMLRNTQSYTRVPLFLAADEEGGVVSRIAVNPDMGLTPLDPMQTFGDKGDPAELYTAMSGLAAGMRNLGFNMNFAPVADVRGSEDADIGDRAFSTDPKICSAMVPVAVRALQDGNVISCLKHFPGYGSVTADAHEGAAVSDKTLLELEQCDLLPFAAGMEEDVAFVMVGHQALPSVTGGQVPSSMSYDIVTELLRNKVGFQNVIITDALDMGAITSQYSAGEAAVKALQAGADMLLMPQDLMTAYQAVLTAAQDGTLSQQRIDESVLRILTTKARFGLLPETEV